MKLVAVDRIPDKIRLVYSNPDEGKIIVYEFDLDDPELPLKLQPHLDQPLLKEHLKQFPIGGVTV
jgi:hypothetical protein